MRTRVDTVGHRSPIPIANDAVSTKVVSTVDRRHPGLRLGHCARVMCGPTWGQAGADGGVVAPYNAGDAAVGGPRGGIARLQRENERLRMERDILKKFIAIFAGVPK